jgi:hypothetical protein
LVNYNITWTRISGSFTVITADNNYRISRNGISDGTKVTYSAENNCIISATISDGTTTYTRYFNFNMIEYIDTI